MKKRATAGLTVVILICSVMICSAASAMEVWGVDIHGFVSQGYMKSDHYNYPLSDSEKGSFQYNELGINFSKKLTKDLGVGIQLFSRDFGAAGNNRITVDWGFADYRLTDWLGFRAGRIKLPLGFYNETRDIDMLRTNIIMPQSLYPDLLRDTVIAADGAGVYGNIDLSLAGSLDYLGVAGWTHLENSSGFEKFFNSQSDTHFYVDGDSKSDITLSGSLKWNTPLAGLILGVSALQSTIETPIRIIATGNAKGKNEADNTFFTLSAEYTWDNLLISAEYQTYDMEYVATDLEGVAPSPVVADDLVPAEGYYLSADYRFTELFSAGAYYSIFYMDTDDRNGDDRQYASDSWEKDFALSLRFDICESLVFKVEGHLVDGTARVVREDNRVRTRHGYNYGVAKVTWSF